MDSSVLTISIGLLWFLDGTFWVLGVLFLSEIWAAKPPADALSPTGWVDTRQRLAVLIPAHNEETEIAETIQSILPQMKEGDRLIAIADNCSDRTAAVARDAGATVLERTDRVLRGKGYALDFGLQYLAKDPPEIVAIVDADCKVAEGSLNALAQRVKDSQRPVQSTYLLRPPKNATLRDQISLFAFTLKNLVRPLGMQVFGWPCVLTGSGMAFPWSLLSQVSLVGCKTADDMQLTVDVALCGMPPLYEPQSRITGRLMQEADAASQRSRWEHGHLEMILTQVPRLFGAALSQRRVDLLVLALDLSIPPLSLFVLLWVGLVLLNLVFFFAGTSHSVALGMGIAAIFPILLGVWRAWWKFGRDILPVQNWVEIPRYFLWKLPIYVRFLTQPQTRWLKTERDAVEPPNPSQEKSP
jgi:cellulose synthase/poly-beta-1,6-N-acetylglucosamine synthase-like glycosyltransferase